MNTYRCQCNINGGDKYNFRQGEMITQEVYDKLPEKIKFKFQKLNAHPQQLSDADVRNLLLDLRERVRVIEAALLEKQSKSKGN